MKELGAHNRDLITPNQAEVRSFPKVKEPTGGFILPKGCKLYEMVTVSENPEDPLDVQGMNRETGEFDPELALIREIRYETAAVSMGTPAVNQDGMSGPIHRGVKRKAIYIDGNVYDYASSVKVVRRKMIRKFFDPFKSL